MEVSLKGAVICCAALLTGFSSGALAQTKVPQAETSAGPAVATFDGTTYVAWAGFHKQPENLGYHVAYTTLGGSQTVFNDVYTTVAPALAAARGTVFLAARGNAPAPASDSIYYSSLSGTALPRPITPIPGAATTASPALAGDSTALFVAWTKANGAVELETFTGSWSIPQATPAVTNPSTAPALAVYNGALYLAWVQADGTQVMYASLPLSGDQWSAPKPVGEGGGAQTTVAPALGVYNALFSSDSGLYVAWIDGGRINYATLSAGIWVPGPIPPGPLATSFTPALLGRTLTCGPGLIGSIYDFNLFYTEPGGDIYYNNLLTGGKCHVMPPPCKGTTCQ